MYQIKTTFQNLDLLGCKCAKKDFVKLQPLGINYPPKFVGRSTFLSHVASHFHLSAFNSAITVTLIGTKILTHLAVGSGITKWTVTGVVHSGRAVGSASSAVAAWQGRARVGVRSS